MQLTSKTVPVAIAGGVAIALALTAGWVRVREPRLNPPVADTLGQGDYVLAATDGTTFTEETLHGAPSAVFFGFTHCPEVYPTTLGEIAVWQEALAEDGEALRVFFITVDPERDTQDVLGDYVSWVPGVTGVTGSRAEIDKAIESFRVHAQKVPLEGGGYTMDHSAFVLLFDAEGRLDAPIGYREDPGRAIAKIRELIG